MATVWEATDQKLGRNIALKILYAHLAADPAFLERFRREALAAAQLHHPNIVQVFDSGKDQGLYYIVMELLRGGSLRELMNEKRLGVAESVATAAAVARALAYAHARGIVHRDVKPANILLSEEGFPKVADFGIARAAGYDELTATRDVIGTAAYLSPEQLKGETPGPESDIFALGVLLYELLAGQRPFKTDGGLVSAASRLTVPAPPLASVAPQVPSQLGEIVDKCLRVEPSKRYRSALSLAEALEPFAGGITTVEIRRGQRSASPPLRGLAPSKPAPRSVAHTTAASKTVVSPGPLPVESSKLPRPSGPSGATHSHALPPRSIRTGYSRKPLPPPPAPLSPRSRGRKALAAAAMVLAIVLLSVAGFVFGRRLVNEGRIPGFPARGTPDAKLVEVRAFDPLGDGSENEQRSRFVRDGDKTTAWSTERYGSAEFGGLKSGVGLLFRFDRKAICQSVTIHTTSPGWSGQVRVADAYASSPDAYRLAGQVTGATTDQQIGTGGASGEYWLLWFTLLPPAGGGYRLEVSEVDFGVCD